MPETGLINQCAGECPVGFWCHEFGLPGPGGICCPLSTKNTENKFSQMSDVITQISQQNPGKCPSKAIDTDRLHCIAKCRDDKDCDKSEEKCCFDGCGMSCVLGIIEYPGNFLI